MKTSMIFLAMMAGLFSLGSFAQNNYMVANVDNRKAPLKFDKPDDDRVIEAYLVVEVINMPFGKRTTQYEVSKLDMVYTNDLGPNNTRTVTPIYKKPKARLTNTIMASKDMADANIETVKPVDVEVTKPAYTEKFVKVDIVDTYANVLDKGYKSIEMLKKVADKYYFEDNLEEAAKYYSELFELDKNLETVYYFRYAQALKAISQTEKSDEMMKLFESKNLNE